MKLIDFLSKACMYAQEHIDDASAWNGEQREDRLQCTSYQVACFLAQNTTLGHHGVGYDVILNELTEHPMKTEKEWKTILKGIVKELGGWK